jgi:hypothetical protein
MRGYLNFALTALLLIGGNTRANTDAFPNSDCAAYIEASTPGPGGVPSVLPDQLLANLDQAGFCLITVIRKSKVDLGPGGFSKDTESRLLSATAAFRAIMTRLAASDQVAANTKGLDKLIEKFRETDDLDVISVLSYGTRSELSDLRLNSVSILGNVIDNKTVCVPLAHLNDPSLLNSANGFNGRANLLGVISVVAPWAYSENYGNIKRTTKAIRDYTSAHAGDPNNYALLALDNIDKRLASQKPDSNKGAYLPEHWRLSCQQYVQGFLPKIVTLDNVRYDPH